MRFIRAFHRDNQAGKDNEFFPCFFTVFLLEFNYDKQKFNGEYLMRKKTTFIVEFLKIIINCVIVPLYFIKFFCDEAVLPGYNENGEPIIGSVYYYYSIFDKIKREGIAYLLWCAIAVIIASITLSILRMTMKESKVIKIASYIFFGVAIIMFFVLLFIAENIRYGY